MFEDRMRPVNKGWKRFPAVKENSNLTLKKVRKSLCDSLVLTVKDVDAPFLRYVPRGVVPKRLPYGQGYMTDEDGLPVTVVHRNRRGGNGWYVFEFYDLNPLKRAGFNDLQIVRRCANFVLRFFDCRIDPAAISVTRLDLAVHVEFDSLGGARMELSAMDASVRESKVRSVMDDRGFDYLASGTPYSTWTTHTYYGNYLSARGGKGGPMVLRVYNTRQKSTSRAGSGDRRGMGLTRARVWKFELQLKNEVLMRSYALGEGATIGAVESRLRIDPSYLLSVYRAVADHYGIAVPHGVGE